MSSTLLLRVQLANALCISIIYPPTPSLQNARMNQTMHFEAHLPGRTLSLTGTTYLPTTLHSASWTNQAFAYDMAKHKPGSHLHSSNSPARPAFHSCALTCLPGGHACAQQLFRHAPVELPMALGTCRPCPSAAAVPLPHWHTPVSSADHTWQIPGVSLRRTW